MENIVSIIDSLKKKFTSKPASPAAITAVELHLGLTFSEEYWTFLTHFGALMYKGEEILGINGNGDCVESTERLRKTNPQLPSNLYVVSNLGIDDIHMLQDEKGTIYEYSPFNGLKPAYVSLSEYISSL